MKLQIALDTDWNKASTILKQVHEYIDIVEIGTPLIFREGLSLVGRVREQFPELMVLADLKIVDAGEMEASLAFQAGVDIVTVLGFAPDQTILGTLKAARTYQKQVMLDMMQVQDLLARSRWLLDNGVDYICVHLAHDLQDGDQSYLSNLRTLRENLPQAKLAIAGGIDLETIDLFKHVGPEIIIVGKAISLADNPCEIARLMHLKLSDE
jgi:3-hexulose-6-phosphate synthase